MGVVFKHRGNFNKTEKFLKGYRASRLVEVLHQYGQQGVAALAAATPVDSGRTASSWSYYVDVTKSSVSIVWTNSNVTSAGTPVAILLQYGHGTRGGGFVQGRDFINSAIAPVMDSIAEAVWQEVRNP